MLAARLHSRDSDPEKLLSIFAQINCQSFVSPESQQYAFINIGKDVLLFIVGKENMHTDRKYFCVKIWLEKRKKSIKIKISNLVWSVCLSLFLTRVFVAARMGITT